MEISNKLLLYRVLLINIIIVTALIIPIFFIKSRSFGLSSDVVSISVSSNGNYFVVGTRDNELILYSKSEVGPIWKSELDYFLTDIAISSDGNYIAASSGSGLYFFHKSNPVPLWVAPIGSVESQSLVKISGNGSYIISNDLDNFYLFSKDSPIPILNLSLHVDDFDISEDGFYIVVGVSNNLYLLNRTSSTPVWTSSAPSNYVKISDDGNYIISAYYSLFYFNRADPIPLWNWTVGEYIVDVGISSDGKNIIAGVGGGPEPNGSIYFFTESSSTPLWNYQFNEFITSVAISSSGNYLAVTSSSSNLHVFSKQEMKPIWTHFFHNFVEISSDGSVIVAASYGYGLGRRVVLFYTKAPLVVDDYYIVILISGISLGIVDLLIYIRRKKKRKKFVLEQKRIEELKNILNISNRIKIDMIQNILNLSKKELNSRISKWSSDYGFIIEEDYLVINKDTLSDFISVLDEEYKKWKNLEREGKTKKEK